MGGDEGANPKPEGRNPKEVRKPKSERKTMNERWEAFLVFEFSTEISQGSTQVKPSELPDRGWLNRRAP